MKFRLIPVFLFISIFCFSQITNTRHWRKTENDSMQNALLLYDEGKLLIALPIYEALYKRHSEESFLKYMYGKCALARSDKHEEALTLLTEVYSKNKKADQIEYDLARANHYNYKFDEALAFVDKALGNRRTTFENQQKCHQLKKYILNAKYFYANPNGAKITNVGPVINTANDEYVPVISADEAIMIYTYVGDRSVGGRQNAFLTPDPNGIYYEDVYQSVKIDGEWTSPKGISTINTNSHDAAIALSPDGDQLFTYRDNGDDHGDIYVSYLRGLEWTTPQKLRGQVNSYSWEGSCSLTSDGRTLYFSSERGGGYGGRDIYRATLQADSTWGNIVNLGDSINTSLDDDAPFIHPDGVTLFYSSKGKNSMGDYDIFQATMNKADSTFKTVVDLGYPINTPDGDRYYVLAANGKTGYYSSGKKGGQGLSDIYMVYPGFVGKPPATYLVKGNITLNGKPVEANISVVVSSKNDVPYTNTQSNFNTGAYLVTMPAGSTFRLTYKYNDYPARTLDIDATNITEYTEKVFNIEYNSAPPADTTKPAVAVTPTVAPKKDSVKTKPAVTDDFVPKNAMQAKIMKYVALYGDVSAEGLEFKVQIAAYKFPKNYKYDHLKGLGKVEQLLLGDGVTRITIGGAFKTLGKAWEHNKKVVRAGQTDAFVTAIYKGKRVFLEELEEMGIFKK